MTKSRNQRIEEINQVLIDIAQGNFTAKSPISDQFDDIDAIASGINMLSEELRDSVITKNYLDSVLKGIVDMLMIFDDQFILTSVNQKTCELLNKPSDYFVGQPIDFLFTKEKAGFIRKLKKSVCEEEQVYNIETEFKVLQKASLPVTLSLSALKNRRTTTGYLLIAKDLKQILLTSNALKQRNQELQTLLYKVSHDLQGPLASMLGLFQVIDQNDHDLDMLRYYLSLVKKSTDKLEKTVRGLLELGVDDDAQQQLTSFDVKHSVEKVLCSLDEFPDRQKVAIEIIMTKPVRLTSVERLFRLILHNIIENSLRYRRTNIDQSQISITVRNNRRGVTILIKDNGQGMSRHVRRRAFDMFYRGNLLSQGSGLGLAIVKSNVEKLGGEVSLKSKLQQGTEVRLFLPSIEKFDLDRY